jgi:hypothetical protein
MTAGRVSIVAMMLLAGFHVACEGGTSSATSVEAGVDARVVTDSAPMEAVSSGDGMAVSPDAASDVGMAPPDAEAMPAPPGLSWVLETSNVIGTAISGTGPNDVWVVGGAGDIWHSTGDGTWTSRVAERGWRLTGVWGSGPNDVYVSVRANFVFHWNGTGWQKQTNGIAIGLTCQTIWGTGPSDIYMADPSIYHSKGDGTWQGVNIPLGAGPFVSIWGSGPNDVWALGSGGVARWNGQIWKNEKPGFVIGVSGIWGSGPGDVYALYGDHLVHTDGTGQWVDQPITIREPTENMLCVWGSGKDDLYIGTDRSRVFHRRTDGRWYPEVVDKPGAVNLTVWGIWGTSAQNIYLMTGRGIYRSRVTKDGGV